MSIRFRRPMSMYRKGCFSNYFFGLLALVYPGIGGNPDDSAGRTAIDCLPLGKIIELVIYHCEVVCYYDQTLAGIFDATLTGIAGNLALHLGGIAKM